MKDKILIVSLWLSVSLLTACDSASNGSGDSEPKTYFETVEAKINALRAEHPVSNEDITGLWLAFSDGQLQNGNQLIQHRKVHLINIRQNGEGYLFRNCAGTAESGEQYTLDEASNTIKMPFFLAQRMYNNSVSSAYLDSFTLQIDSNAEMTMNSVQVQTTFEKARVPDTVEDLAIKLFKVRNDYNYNVGSTISRESNGNNSAAGVTCLTYHEQKQSDSGDLNVINRTIWDININTDFVLKEAREFDLNTGEISNIYRYGLAKDGIYTAAHNSDGSPAFGNLEFTFNTPDLYNYEGNASITNESEGSIQVNFDIDLTRQPMLEIPPG